MKKLKADGIQAHRVPLSGMQAHYKGDIIIEERFQAEVKARAGGEGWKRIEQWLSGNDFLFLVADRQEPLCVVPWSRFIELFKKKINNSRIIEKIV